jgi:hypothetical protein
MFVEVSSQIFVHGAQYEHEILNLGSIVNISVGKNAKTDNVRQIKPTVHTPIDRDSRVHTLSKPLSNTPMNTTMNRRKTPVFVVHEALDTRNRSKITSPFVIVTKTV